MSLAEVRPQFTDGVSETDGVSGTDGFARLRASDVRAAGRRAARRLVEAERLRAAALADLVDYHDGYGPSIDGFVSLQRHLVTEAGIANREADRLERLTRFCHRHPLVTRQLAVGMLTLDHADALGQVADHIDPDEFAAALCDLVTAADGVEFSVFVERLRSWQWRSTPQATEDDVATAHDGRSLTMQPGLFGGCHGRFRLDAAGATILTAALHTEPDPNNSHEPARTLRQRQADRLVELAGLALHGDLADNPSEPDGARRGSRSSVDVVIDLPTLLGADFDLDDHRTQTGAVDWDSIRSGFALTTTAPRPVLAQFLCDASWRTLITAGGSVVLDYTHAKPELSPSQRRAVQRRDQHCQFHGCDRHWSWCDVHHIREKANGGCDTMANLALLCRRHHTLVHQGGWQLSRGPNGNIVTTSP
jgi:hypothetical protein